MNQFEKNPYASTQPITASSLPRQSHTSLIVALLMSILFVVALGFGIWAFIGMQANKTNLDAKIEAASEVAVKEAENSKELEFAERDKNPFKSYAGSATYGALNFSFPRTWSVYTEEKSSGTLLDFFAQPIVVNGTGNENSFALRVQIVDAQYDKVIAGFQKSATDGKVAVSAFRPEKVTSVVGSRISGEIVKGKVGSMVLLPQRDKTFLLWTESPDNLADFEKVIQSITFVP